MRSMVTVLATAVSISLLACGVAAASITLFEEPLFHAGLSVNGQSGVGGFPWKSAPPGAIPACVPTPTNGQYDQAVVANTVAPAGEPPGFGSQSLRMSNACASGEFFYQTYSPQELQQVGEARPNKVFIAEFAFLPTTPDHQPGLFLSVSPDSGEGSRMSWVGLQDTPNGIQVSVNDTPDVDGEFVAHPGPLLGRTSPHRIRFRIKVNPGPDNDVVRISVDGDDLVSCFTTWENYYRTAPEQAPPPNRNTPATINSLQFRSSVPGPPALLGRGYLFDNVSITPSNGPGPQALLGRWRRPGGEKPAASCHRQNDTNAVRAAGRPHHVPDHRQKPRRRAGARAEGVRPRTAGAEVCAVQYASASRCRPSAMPPDPSAATRSAQGVRRDLPAERERHNGCRYQQRGRGRPHRVGAVTDPARGPPDHATATPGRPGCRDGRGPETCSLPGGADRPRPRCLLR